MKGRAFAAVVLSALLLLSGLGIGGWWLLWQRGPLELAHHPLTMPRAARFVPASAAFSLYLYSDGQRPVDYARAVAPARQRRQAGEAVARLRDGAFAAAGLDYPGELAGWLGDELAMALIDDPVASSGDGSPDLPQQGWLLALSSRDDDGARRFLQRFWQTRSLAGTDLQVSSYRGMGLISGRGALLGSRPEPLATALVDDDLVLIASGRNLLERALDVSQIPSLNQAGQPGIRQGLSEFASGAALAVASPAALHTWLGLPDPGSGSTVTVPAAAGSPVVPSHRPAPPTPAAAGPAAMLLRPAPAIAAETLVQSTPGAEVVSGGDGLAPSPSGAPMVSAPMASGVASAEAGGADAAAAGSSSAARTLSAIDDGDVARAGSSARQADGNAAAPAAVAADVLAEPAQSAAAPNGAPGEAVRPSPEGESGQGGVDASGRLAPAASLNERSSASVAPAASPPTAPPSASTSPAAPASSSPAAPPAPPVASPTPASSATAVPAGPALLAVLQPHGPSLELRARLALPGVPQLRPLSPQLADQLLTAMGGSPTSLALIQDPASIGQQPLLRPLLERSLDLRPLAAAERLGPLPALLAEAVHGPLLFSAGEEGWQLRTRSADPLPAQLDPLLQRQGLFEAPLQLDGHSLRVWTRLSLPGRGGRRERSGSAGDQLQAPLAGWREQRQDLAWWGQTLASLESAATGRALAERRRGLEELNVPSAPLQWSLDGAGARTLLRSWQPWRLLSALAGGGLDGPVRGLALAVDARPEPSALDLRARLTLGS